MKYYNIFILSLIMVIYGCDIRYEEASKSEELDPNLPAVVVPLQIFETSHTIGSCFYKNNFLKMIATHPQATNYAWYKCDPNYPSNQGLFLSDSSYYKTSLSGLYRLDITKEFPLIGKVDTSVFIELEYCPTWIDIPSSFTPDSEQQFNTWQPILEGVNTFYYRITDEDDHILFESTSLQNSFDGNYGGLPLPSGTYHYYISGTYKSRVLFEKDGDFELVR